MGDRYAYLAMVGVVFAVTDLAALAAARRPRQRMPLLALAAAVSSWAHCRPGGRPPSGAIPSSCGRTPWP